MADLSHILIMLIDILPQTCDLSGFNFFMILVISSPLKEIFRGTLIGKEFFAKFCFS